MSRPPCVSSTAHRRARPTPSSRTSASSEANEFRRLVERSFAAAGREVSVHPDRVEDRSGTTFRLWNIGAPLRGRAVRATGRRSIDDHVRLVTTPTRELSDLSQQEIEVGPLPAARRDSVGARPGRARATPGSSHRGCWRCCRSTCRTPWRRRRARRSSRTRDARQPARPRTGEPSALLDATGCVAETGRGRGAAAGSRPSPATPSSPRAWRCCSWRRSSSSRARTTGVAACSSRSPSRHQLLYRTINARGRRGRRSTACSRRAVLGFSAEAGPLSPDVFWVRNRRWTQATSWRAARPRVLRGHRRS